MAVAAHPFDVAFDEPRAKNQEPPSEPDTSPAPGPFHDLERCLCDQIQAHADLACLLDEERRALAGLNLDAIHACARRKMEIGQRIALAEAQRRRTCEALAQSFAPQPPAANSQQPILKLSDIAALAPEPHRPLITDLRARLLEAIERTGRGQSRNQTLCERFMTIMSRSMDAVQQTVAALPLYNTTAKVGQTRWRGVVIRQTA